MTSSPRRSTLISLLLHAGAIALIVFTTGVQTPITPKLRYTPLVGRDISKYLPPVRREHGGGGGGARDETDAALGRLPRFAPRQFTPPAAVIRNFDPLLPIEPTLVGDSHVVVPAINLPNYGDPSGPPGPPSGGRGDGGGIGNGRNGGVGNGEGPGAGGGDDCCGLYNPSGGTRGGITTPVVLYKIEPEYTDEARQARIQGTVILQIEVSTDGHAGNIQVRRSLGLGLDERAVEAVSRWKFRPGQRDGRPVVTVALVEVSFRLL